MRNLVTLAMLFTFGVSLGGCALPRVLSAPDPEFLDLLEQQRQQEAMQSLHQQAVAAHEQAVRIHQEMTTPPPAPPAPIP